MTVKSSVFVSGLLHPLSRPTTKLPLCHPTLLGPALRRPSDVLSRPDLSTAPLGLRLKRVKGHNGPRSGPVLLLQRYFVKSPSDHPLGMERC